MDPRVILCCFLVLAPGCDGSSDNSRTPGDALPGDVAQGGDGYPGGGDTSPTTWAWTECLDGTSIPATIGAQWVEATADTRYCTTFSSQAMSSDPVAALAQLTGLWHEKSEIRFKPGQYGLPAEAGSYDFDWPNCAATAAQAPAQWMPSAQLAVSSSMAGNWTLELALGQADEEVTFTWQQFWMPPSAQPLTELDKTQLSAGSLETSATWCADRLDGPYGRCRAVHRCLGYNHLSVIEERYLFDGGQVDFDIMVVGGSIAGNTDEALIVHAEGNLLGTPFVQEDYFAVGHIPAHHNLGGANLVMFETPIQSHCGLLTAALGVGLSGPIAARVITVECDKSFKQELTNATGERL